MSPEDHMERIANMRCICCELLGTQQASKTNVHHIRADREGRNDYLTIPLCHDDCHQGQHGVHGDRTYLRALKMTEWGLLAVIISRL
jgi:hypothetical protein